MILVFKSLDQLQLSLLNGTIPTEVVCQPCDLSRSKANSDIAIEFFSNEKKKAYALKLPKKKKQELENLGIFEAENHIGPVEFIPQLLQIIPLKKSTPSNITNQTVVIFEIDNSKVDYFSSLAMEILKLGNDRQSFRWSYVNPDQPKILLRVVNPPYYTLLRAIDELDGESIKAYAEQHPKIWVEVGYLHPFAKQFQIPDDQILFINKANQWNFEGEQEFKDVYEQLNIKIPSVIKANQAELPTKKINVELKLTPGDSSENAELWIIPSQGMEQLNKFVKEADERLIRKLRFAVINNDSKDYKDNGMSQVIIRAITRKTESPILQIPYAIGYKSFWKLPNLFLPVGTNLYPTLRRETIRQLLAANPDELVWLQPREKNSFTPFRIPENSFEPLENWVAYVLEQNATELQTWIQSTLFEFDSFVGLENPMVNRQNQPNRPAGEKQNVTDKKSDKQKEKIVPIAIEDSVNLSTTQTATEELLLDNIVPTETKAPGELALLRSKLEGEFLNQGEGTLGDERRTKLWPQLANCYYQLNEREDATIAYLNALWQSDQLNASLALAWAKSEVDEVSLKQLDQLLNDEKITEKTVRSVVSLILVFCRDPQFASRRTQVIEYLKEHENRLPVRAIWLAHRELSRVANSDLLGLARCRDRILARLYDTGLEVERDLPRFLRYAGLQESERGRVIREKAKSLYQLVRNWAEKSLQLNPLGDWQNSVAFIDLAFAFAFATLQDSKTSKQLNLQATQFIDKIVITKPKPGEEENKIDQLQQTFKKRGLPLILKAYQYRIDRAIESKPLQGPVAFEILKELESISLQANETSSNKKQNNNNVATSQNPFGMCYYNVTRFFEQSAIIDPQERKEPTDTYNVYSDDIRKKLKSLQSISNSNELSKTIRQLLTECQSNSDLLNFLHRTIPLSGRVGEELAKLLIEKVPSVFVLDNNQKAISTVSSTIDPNTVKALTEKQGQILERAMNIAVHFDRRDWLNSLTTLYINTLKQLKDHLKCLLIDHAGRTTLQCMKKIAMRDDIENFYTQLHTEFFQSQPLEKEIITSGTKNSRAWSEYLRASLSIASGWIYLDRFEYVKNIIDITLKEILNPNPAMHNLDYFKLLKSLLYAYGSGSAEKGLTQIEELFRSLKIRNFKDILTTSNYFSWLAVPTAEAVCLVIAADDSRGDSCGKRWRDEDELIVRKRMSDELRALSRQS